MLLEYLSDEASAQRPVLLLCGDDPAEARELYVAIADSLRGEGDVLRVDGLPGIEGLGGCSLTLEVAAEDGGVLREASKNSFRCVLTSGSWHNVLGLLEPFLDAEPGAPTSFQYLSNGGTIDWIISTRREW